MFGEFPHSHANFLSNEGYEGGSFQNSFLGQGIDLVYKTEINFI